MTYERRDEISELKRKVEDMIAASTSVSNVLPVAKLPYEAPVLTRVGSFEDVTQDLLTETVLSGLMSGDTMAAAFLRVS